MYIMDASNYRIRKVTAGIITTVAGTGSNTYSDGPATSAGFVGPQGIALDSATPANLYITDYNSNGISGSRIRRLSPDGMITTVAGTGVNGFSGDNGLATSAQLRNPNGLWVDSTGHLYIADTANNRIREVTNP
jgi:hypothetical protein